MKWFVTGALAVASALVFAACGGGDGGASGESSAQPRSFQMGISSLPRELTTQAYADAFRLAGEAGDVILIQRAPPWEDFLPGASVSNETADTTAAEIAAASDHDLSIFFAIDPTDGSSGRDRLNGLPTSREGATFADADIRSAFAAYAEYVALNYQPTYLALGVEMNLYFQRQPDDLESFRSLYQEAYQRVKARSPETLVTLTFQYEDLQSLLPTQERHYPDWPLLEQFDEHMDVAAITSYPSLSFPGAAAIPENYYSQLTGFTDKPIIIAEAGFSSEVNAEGVNSGSEEDQAAFAERLLEEADDLDMRLVIWFAGWDPAYAEGTAYAVFRSIGLLRSDGSEKPVWRVWHDAAQRVYEGSSLTRR